MAIHRSLKRFLRMIHASKIGFLAMAMCLPGCFQKHEDILKIAIGAEPATLDPQIASGVQEASIITALFEGLLIPDAKTLEPFPGMAQSYTISPDGLTYTFTLRDQIFWSNGDPVVAQNFIDAIERGLTPSIASPWTGFYCLLKNAQKYYDAQNVQNGEAIPFSSVGVKAVSTQELTLTLEKSVPFFLDLLMHPAWAPLNRKAIEQCGGFFDRDNHWIHPKTIVSNGAYLLESIQIGDKVVLKKNPKYWDAANVHIPCVHVFTEIEQEAQENMFDTGQLHVTAGVSPEKIAFYKKQGTLKLTKILECGFFWFHCQKKPLDDVRIRRALSLAINRRELSLLRKHGGGDEAYSIVPPGTKNYAHRNLFQDDIQQAKALLAEAGYPNGKAFPKIALTVPGTKKEGSVSCEAIQEMWRKNLGIETDMIYEEWRSFLRKLHLDQFDIILGSWIADFNDATTFLDLFHSQNMGNYSQWINKEYDHLLEQATQVRTITARAELLMKAEALIIKEMPAFPYRHGFSVHLVSPEIEGWHPTVLDWHPIKNIRFK